MNRYFIGGALALGLVGGGAEASDITGTASPLTDIMEYLTAESEYIDCTVINALELEKNNLDNNNPCRAEAARLAKARCKRWGMNQKGCSSRTDMEGSSPGD